MRYPFAMRCASWANVASSASAYRIRSPFLACRNPSGGVARQTYPARSSISRRISPRSRRCRSVMAYVDAWVRLAGGRYEVRGERTSAVWLGSQFDWTAWVVDLGSGEVIGGERPNT